MIWNPYSPPEGTHIAPCPDCGGNLDPRVSEDEDGQWWDIDCAGTVDRDGCGWCAYEVEDLAPFTLAGAPWTRDLWAEVVLTRGERDILAARVRELEAPGECQSVHKLRAALAAVLDRLTEPGHPGRACLRTGWVPVEQVEQWRSLLSPSWREGQGRTDGEE